MSTRSYVGYSEGGDVRYVYHHFDGYPTGVGKELVKNYNSLEQAKELVRGGDISHCFKDEGGPLHYATRSTWDDSRGGQNEAWEDVKPKDPYGVDGYAEAFFGRFLVEDRANFHGGTHTYAEYHALVNNNQQ